MYVLLDVQRNTDLVELLCVAKSRGINYDVVEDFNQFLEMYRSVNHFPSHPTPLPPQDKPAVRKKPQPKKKENTEKDLNMGGLSQMKNITRPADLETTDGYADESFKNNSNFKETMSYQYYNNNNNNRYINKENMKKCGVAMPFTTQMSLMIHARTHYKKMGYECSDCGALFFQYVAASNHVSLCHLGTLATVRDILTKDDMKELEKCMKECFTTESLFPVKATYIPKLAFHTVPLQATDSNSSVGSDVICIDDSDDDAPEPKNTPLALDGR